MKALSGSAQCELNPFSHKKRLGDEGDKEKARGWGGA